MIEFIDKTSEQNGTPINRDSLMAIQGFIANKTTKDENGNIIQINTKTNETLIISPINVDGEYTTTFIGEKTITLKTILKPDGLEEVLL